MNNLARIFRQFIEAIVLGLLPPVVNDERHQCNTLRVNRAQFESFESFVSLAIWLL